MRDRFSRQQDMIRQLETIADRIIFPPTPKVRIQVDTIPLRTSAPKRRYLRVATAFTVATMGVAIVAAVLLFAFDRRGTQGDIPASQGALDSTLGPKASDDTHLQVTVDSPTTATRMIIWQGSDTFEGTTSGGCQELETGERLCREILGSVPDRASVIHIPPNSSLVLDADISDKARGWIRKGSVPGGPATEMKPLEFVDGKARLPDEPGMYVLEMAIDSAVEAPRFRFVVAIEA